MGKTSAYVIEQFIKRAKEYEGDDCLEWPFAVNSHGYGNYKGKNAQRFTCPGEPTEERWQAAHLCGNRLCVNPNHLRWSSQHENELDKLIHGKKLGRPKVGPNVMPLSEYLKERNS